jgi:uncharacterized protein (DUF2141 family)
MSAIMRFSGLFLAVFLAPSMGAAPALEAQGLSNSLGRIEILVTGVEGSTGIVRCALFDSPEGFPLGMGEGPFPAGALQRTSSRPGWGDASCAFLNVPPGTYAVAVFHDRNENGTLDTNVFGIPSEGVGASRNVLPRLGPPKFSDNEFTVGRGERVELEVQLRYRWPGPGCRCTGGGSAGGGTSGGSAGARGGGDPVNGANPVAGATVERIPAAALRPVRLPARSPRP